MSIVIVGSEKKALTIVRAGDKDILVTCNLITAAREKF
jgi:hypothetical protein